MENIKAQTISEATKIIKQTYPNAHVVSFKFDKNFAYTINKPNKKKKMKERTMKVAIVDNMFEVWNDEDEEE